MALPSGGAYPAVATVGDDDSLAVAAPFVAFAFYNVGINNSELLGAAWNTPASARKAKLRTDLQNIFAPDRGIQALFLSEFGGMQSGSSSSCSRSLCRCRRAGTHAWRITA